MQRKLVMSPSDVTIVYVLIASLLREGSELTTHRQLFLIFLAVITVN
jgi:hypothetical protein